MRVPRGQASYALGHVHYNYPAAGGSPPNYLMCPKLEEITLKVNSVLGTNFNTILLNKYVTGEDHIGYHSDNEGQGIRICHARVWYYTEHTFGSTGAAEPWVYGGSTQIKSTLASGRSFTRSKHEP